MSFERESIVKKLNAQVRVRGQILGVASGSGMTSKYAILGGADFILALSAGKFRQMGRGSLSCYLCYTNSNDTVMDFAFRELMPVMKDVPLVFGLNANDPYIHIYEYIKKLKELGFAGVNNFPTVGLIDGKFREALEEEGITYDREVEAIRLAHFLNLFTVAFVFDEKQAEKMLNAGADVICAHLGLTTGGVLGAKKVRSLENACKMADRVFETCKKIRPGVLKMVYGGPIKTPLDMAYFFHNTACCGFIGGSSFERIPAEKAIFETVRAFCGTDSRDDPIMQLLNDRVRGINYVEFVKKYVSTHYREPIYLNELAFTAHISPSYLSTLFKRIVGKTFSEYLIEFRLNKAKVFAISDYGSKAYV